VYAALALLGTNIGVTDLATPLAVGAQLGYSALVSAAPLSQTVVQLSGGTHFPVAAAFAALCLSAVAPSPREALSPQAARLLNSGLAAAVIPVGATLSSWLGLGGFNPLMTFIICRLALEFSTAALPLLFSTPRAPLLPAWRSFPTATPALKLLSALKASLLFAAFVLILSPDSATFLLWNETEKTLPALVKHLLPALAGAFLAAAAAAAAVTETLMAGASSGRRPAMVLCAGLAALGASHAQAHLHSITAGGYTAHAGVMVSLLAVAAAACAAWELHHSAASL